jgi:hypothetical protein
LLPSDFLKSSSAVMIGKSMYNALAIMIASGSFTDVAFLICMVNSLISALISKMMQ